MTLDVRTVRQVPPNLALKKSWIEKDGPGHAVRLPSRASTGRVHDVRRRRRDRGTPTGSRRTTSLLGRGPIVAPPHRSYVHHPVSPHTLFDHSLVLARRTSSLRVGDRPAIAVDRRQRLTELVPGDRRVPGQATIPPSSSLRERDLSDPQGQVRVD